MDKRQYRTTDPGGREWRVTAAWGDHNGCYYLDLCRASPKDSPDREKHTQMAVDYCLEHPRWRLSLQTHKYVGLE